MILLDANALVAFLSGEPAQDEVAQMLRSGTAAVLAVNLSETLDVLVRVRGHEMDEVEDRLVPLIASVLPVMTVGEPEARRAASLRAAHYHHKTAPLSLADCLLLAATAIHDADVATSDVLILQTAKREGLRTRRLPRSA